MKKALGYLLRFFKFVLGVFTHRLWLKLLSLVLALILWTYIVSTNTSLTRTKQFDNISVDTGSLSELSAKTLALATDIQGQYTGYVDVTVEVPQSRYTLLKEENITLTADFSGISQAGRYEIPLRGNTTYGEITRLNPSTVLVTVEDLVERVLTAELEIINMDEENYWYNVENASLNPKTITVSGPSSIMQTVTRAVVQVDVDGRSSTFTRGFTSVKLLDASDKEVPTQLLTRSTSASVVNLEIYPKKKLDVNIDQNQLQSLLPEGQEIVGVTVQPETVIVAGSSDLLNTLDSLSLELNGIQDISGTHTVRLSINSRIRYASATEVTLTVTTRQAEDEENE